MLRNLLILLVFASCGTPGWNHDSPEKVIDILYIRDTVFISDSAKWSHHVDSLEDELFLSRYKIERVKHYLNIVDRNPSQLKFLKGWVKRAVE